MKGAKYRLLQHTSDTNSIVWNNMEIVPHIHFEDLDRGEIMASATTLLYGYFRIEQHFW